LRVGKVLEVSNPEWSNKLIEMKVDFGSIGTRTIFAGIRKFIALDDLVGKKYVFVTNLAPRQLGQGVSQGMMLVASNGVNHCPLRVDELVSEGSPIK